MAPFKGDFKTALVAWLLLGLVAAVSIQAQAVSSQCPAKGDAYELSWVRKVNGEVVGSWSDTVGAGAAHLELGPYEIFLLFGGTGRRPEFPEGVRFYHADFWEYGQIWARAVESDGQATETWEFTLKGKTLIDSTGHFPEVWHKYKVWSELEGEVRHSSKVSFRPGWYVVTCWQGEQTVQRILLATPEAKWEECPPIPEHVIWAYLELPDGTRMLAECQHAKEVWWLESEDGAQSESGPSAVAPATL